MVVWIVLTSAEPAAAGLSAEAALANYGRLTGTGSDGADRRCAAAPAAEITVCARDAGAGFRLPLPEQRFGPGEVVRHPSEVPPAMGAFRGPPGEPSRLGDTIRKGVGLLKSVVTGEDPGY